MFMKVPFNYLYLAVYAIFAGALVGMICLEYEVQSVCLVFALCAVIIFALTIYAVYTDCDFTGYGAYIFVAVIGLMLLACRKCLPSHRWRSWRNNIWVDYRL